MKINYIECSPRGSRSHSSKIANQYIEQAKKNLTDLNVRQINVWDENLPEFNGETLNAKYSVLAGADPESKEAAAWSAKYESVLDCDGPGRFAWDFYQPSPSDTYGEFDKSGYFASFYQECTVNEGQTADDIRAVVAKFEEYLESAASFLSLIHI